MISTSVRARSPFDWILRLGVPVASVVTLVVAVAAWGVDVPFWDQWNFIHHLRAWHDGDLTLAQLWRPHNEHRLFAPQLVMLALALISDWDIRFELWTNVALALLAWAVFLQLAREAIGRPPAWLVALSSLSIFGLGQWENWTWGWQIQIFLNVSMVMLGVLLLSRGCAQRGSWRLGGAALCGVIASYSFAPGLLFWPLAMPLVLRGKDGRVVRGAAWVLVTVLVAFFYLHDLSPETGIVSVAEVSRSAVSLSETGTSGMDTSEMLRWLLHFGGYVAIYLGGAVFAFNGQWALYAGPILGLAWAALGVERLVRAGKAEAGTLVGRALPFLLLAGYGAGAACLTATGRLEQGIGQALSSRYVSVSQLFWLGLLGVVAVLGRAAPARWRAVVAVLSAVVASGLVLGSVAGAAEMRSQSEVRGEIRRQILAGAVTDEALVLLYPNTAEARRGLSRLRRIRLGLYREGLYREGIEDP